MTFSKNKIALVAFLTFAALPGHSLAQSRTFGIGAESPIAVGPLLSDPDHLMVPGLSLRYQLSEGLGLQLIGSVQSQFFSQDVGPSSAVTLGGIALRAHLRLFDVDSLRVGAVFGGSFWSRRTKRGDVVTSNRIVSVEAGLRPELFLADGRISFHLQVGLTFALTFDDATGLTDESIGFSLARGADFLGAAGLTIWFGGSGSSSEPAPERRSSPPPRPQPRSAPVDTGWSDV